MEICEMLSTTKKEGFRAIKIYGEILSRRRRERGITLAEFTERTGISREDLDAAERGLLDLSPAQKQRIKKFLRRQKII